MNLYIIGNGFDLAHGLPTSYFDFRKYLDASDWQFLVDLESLYDCTPNSIIELVYDRLWKEFEANLASVNDSEMIDAGIQIKMGLESGDVEIEDTLDVHWEQQYGYIEKLNDYIKSWAKSIDVRVPKKTNKIKPKTNDLFISFNYTLLLEKTYRIESDQILHIHGSVDRGDQLQPVLGHGNKHKIHDARKKARVAKEAYMEKETSIYNALANYYERTCKDVDYYLFFHDRFFRKLASIQQVFIIGHSLGDVDLPYFKKIFEKVKENTVWHVYFYKDSELAQLSESIMSIGVSPENIRVLPAESFFDRF